MHVEKRYLTYTADQMIRISSVAKAAYDEIIEAIGNMVGNINNSSKKVNSVAPIKNGLVNMLHDNYNWEKEHHLTVFLVITAATNVSGVRAAELMYIKNLIFKVINFVLV